MAWFQIESFSFYGRFKICTRTQSQATGLGRVVTTRGRSASLRGCALRACAWPHIGRPRLPLVWPWPGRGMATLAAPLAANHRPPCPAGPLCARPPLLPRLPLMLLLPSMSRVTMQSRSQSPPLPSCHSRTCVRSLHRAAPSLALLGAVRTLPCTPSSRH